MLWSKLEKKSLLSSFPHYITVCWETDVLLLLVSFSAGDLRNETYSKRVRDNKDYHKVFIVAVGKRCCSCDSTYEINSFTLTTIKALKGSTISDICQHNPTSAIN